MASNSTSSPFDPLNQVFFILGPDGETQIPVTPTRITALYRDAASLSILYGSQIGASFMMLATILLMTPKARFRRLPTIISIAALALNLIRMVLLAVYFTTPWLNIYSVVSGDLRFIPQYAYNVSVTATVLSIPVTVLIEAALFAQAWSMLQLWRPLYRFPATAISLALVLTTIGFNFAVTIIQTRAILFLLDPTPTIWVRQAYLGLITASICWFCFLFNARLVIHMWQNRSILPSLKGLKAMDVLVITNGILMFVPVVFAALEFKNFRGFESASLTQTSVIVVLPLGTLVAQRLANPAWFGATIFPDAGNHATDGCGACGSPLTSTSGTSSATVKRPLLMSAHSNGGGGFYRGACGAVVTSRVAAASRDRDGLSHEKARFQRGDAVDRELAKIDQDDLGNGVRVDIGIEQGEERLPMGDKERRGS
ncbi:hypothetical protein MMYC01_205075 [Madurella mycetomatis]|uniref:Pheromone alpha factor receptor n=1 Tax=Madurella mycetomatis TaxID=100816 RepID=A0A175W3I2_9PEZI|nr:hypothetical protein MMYC01_205075 [Madurella mycetomatis]